MMAARTPLANGIGAQRRADRHFLQILDAGRQRARTQRQRQVLRFLLGEGPGDAALIMDLFLDGGNRLYPVVEHHRQLVADVRAGKGRKAPSAIAGQGEVHIRPAILVVTGIGGAQIAAAHRRSAADEPVHFAHCLPGSAGAE